MFALTEKATGGEHPINRGWVDPSKPKEPGDEWVFEIGENGERHHGIQRKFI